MDDGIRRVVPGTLQRLYDAGPPPTWGDKPILMDRAEVTVRGDPLSDLWWQGRQWAVTSFGLECRDGTYYIDAHRLAEDIDTHGWPAHVSEKNWVDVEDFLTAWLVALSMHGKSLTQDQVRGAISRATISR
jgi:hypothetical protein